MIDALRGLDRELLPLIGGGKYFVIHAARQSGKTTLLQALATQVNAGGNHYALYCSLENLEGLADAAEGIPAIVKTVKSSLARYSLPGSASFAEGVDYGDPYNAFQNALEAYCRQLDKPLVLLFDEADCLSGATLIAFLRQLRNGYVNRAYVPFIHSLALTGMRNIRDYRDEYRQPDQTLGSASPFNIVAETFVLQNFTRGQIAGLYAQYTADTGQAFLDAAVDRIWEQTQGQPWLVNAVAKLVVKSISTGAAQAPVTGAMASEAIQALILRRDAHFDSLTARLREERVRRIIEPVIIGKEAAITRNSDDYSYVKDLGLIRDDRGRTEPANPIYGEVIIRTLNQDTQMEIEKDKDAYLIPKYLKDGVVDMDALLRDFQVFWRENESIWRKKYDYQEAAPQLVLQAFLQRVVNGGGQIQREMAAGTGRTDICVVYRGRKYPVELKIRRDDGTYGKGVEQTAGYMDTLGCAEGWLVLFDQTQNLSWDDKLYIKKESLAGKTVTVYGC
ncbi:MAG: ATP-binding protein [Clostridiales bacterium]|nr:ATP-binding protein [Clostridiales bacterium]